MPVSVVSTTTAVALRELLRKRKQPGPPVPRGGEIGRVPLLVRCTSATAAGGSGVSAECYPAVVIDPHSDELVTDQPELGNVWLTVMSSGGPAVPVADKEYHGLMSGTHTEGSDTRPRVFAASVGGSSLTDAGMTSTNYSITADNTWEDTSLTFSLPGAGTYQLYGTVSALARVSATPPGFIRVRFWDTTNSNAIPSTASSIGVVTASVVNMNFIQTVGFQVKHVATGSASVRLEALRDTGPTWTTANIIGTGGAGSYVTRAGYVKI